MKVNSEIAKDKRQRFLCLKAPEDLARLLNLSNDDLLKMISTPIYRSFYIPKKRTGSREIMAPDKKLLQHQSKIASFLNAVYNYRMPESVHGFISSEPNSKQETLHQKSKVRNIMSNASVHLNRKYVLNIDLKDFFPSVSATRVRKIFQDFPFYFEPEMATCLALLCTYEKRLPTGSPTSPVLSNFACRAMDKKLYEYASQNELRYSRYADDLTFSSDEYFSDNTVQNIFKLIEKEGFTINHEKFRIQSSFVKQTVTGIKVNKKLNLDRSFVRNLRAVFYDINKNGVDKASVNYFGFEKVQAGHQLIRSLIGKIQYLGQVRGKNDSLYLKYLTKVEVLQILHENKLS